MKSLNINTKKGFTIIEVVLVLAIAGLIFLMVFIALPNMQMSQRNQRRRNDYSSLSAMVTSYVGNNNGKMPSKIAKTWMNSDGTDPDTANYTETDVKSCNPTSNTAGQNCTMTNISPQRNTNQVYVIKNASCSTSDGNTPVYAIGERNFVIYGYIETAVNTGGTYCLASNA